MFKKKPHAHLFPRVDRVDEIKAGYKKKQEENREAAKMAELERVNAEAEEKRQAEEDIEKKKAAEVERKAKRPWKLASFAPEAIELKELEEEPTPKTEHAKTKVAPDVEQSLEAIYMEGGKEIPDLSKLERRRSKRWLFAFLGLILTLGVLAGSAYAGFYFFQPFREYRGEGLHLTIEGPQAIALGREETFVVEWANRDQQPISAADIRLGLPHDFTVTALEPAPSEKETQLWKLGYLQGHDQGTIKVKGIFTGALGTQSAIQAIGSYRPWSFSRDLDTVATQALEYKNTVLIGVLSAPPKAVAGDAVTVKYAVGNNGVQAMKGLSVRFQYPRGFVPNAVATSSLGNAAQGELIVPLRDLAPHTTSTVEFPGTFISGSSGDMLFHAETGRRESDQNFLTAQIAEVRVPVLAGDLTLRFVANGSDANRTMLPGEPVRITIGYQNTSPEPIKDASILLSFESFVNGKSATGTSLLDWKRLDDSVGGASTTKTRVQTIRYDKKQISTFENLAPQSEGTIEVVIPSLMVASGTKDGAIQLTLQGLVPTVGGTKVNRIVRAQPITLRYRSDVEIAVEARYYTEEGAPIGSGPLPPIAGKTTAYRVMWSLSKMLHPLQDITVSAVLPNIGAWSGQTIQDAGTVSYDEPSRTVTWTLNQMPEGTQALEVGFEVQLTPEQIDVGRFAALLGETKFQATDPVVNEAIVRVKPALTTDLRNDEGARGKGVVRKE